MRIGDRIHFVLHDGPRAGECRPGLVVRVQDEATQTAVVQVFTDGLEDGSRFHNAPARLTVREGAVGEPGRFHPEHLCSK